ncbi:MAG: diguanylate cyclase [Synergistaceae bacterium]
MEYKQEIDKLTEQIKLIVLGNPISDSLICKDIETSKLQETITSFSEYVLEANAFLRHLSRGELNAEPPRRENNISGELKALHAGLKHLVWQTERIANGDYSQRVDFLGEFSKSFNEMIVQLKEREEKLKQQTAMFSENNKLFRAVIDGLSDVVLVIDRETQNILYTNKSPDYTFCYISPENLSCAQCDIVGKLRSMGSFEADNLIPFEYKCKHTSRVFYVTTFIYQWDEHLTNVHYIRDITYEKRYQQEMENIAYCDLLTRLYNRRYFEQTLSKRLTDKVDILLCMIDLDDLKSVNDTFGHSAGDEYLVAVAFELIKNFRKSDVICRIGGDEFAIIFENCEENLILEKLSLVNKKLKSISNKFLMSISYGVARADKENETSIDKIVGKADERMYKNKMLKRKDK